MFYACMLEKKIELFRIILIKSSRINDLEIHDIFLWIVTHSNKINIIKRLYDRKTYISTKYITIKTHYKNEKEY